MKKIGNYLLAKDAHAIVVALVCALLPLFYLPTGFLATIIVGLVTLQKGAKAGFWVVAWVALPAVATLVLRHLGGFDVLLLQCIAIWMMACLLQRYRSWGLVLEAAALVGVLLIVGLHLLYPDIQQWWVGHLTAYINEVAKASEWKLPLTPAEVVKRIAPFATGLVFTFFLASVTLKLMVARFWQSLLVDSDGFAKEFLQLRIGQFSAVIAAVLVLLALFKIAVFKDTIALVLLPFAIAGLSIAHFMARLQKPFIAMVIVAYVGLIFFPKIIFFALAMMGFVDSWTDIRTKVVKK